MKNLFDEVTAICPWRMEDVPRIGEPEDKKYFYCAVKFTVSRQACREKHCAPLIIAELMAKRATNK